MKDHGRPASRTDPRDDRPPLPLAEWISVVAGIFALAQVAVIVVLAFTPIFRGTQIRRTLVVLGSPSLPAAGIAIVSGVVALRSSRQREAWVGILLGVVSLAGLFAMYVSSSI